VTDPQQALLSELVAAQAEADVAPGDLLALLRARLTRHPSPAPSTTAFRRQTVRGA
jgi:hypothetical protein